jgi:glycosyltransferase involved in cell wall biosynthesis
MRIALCAQSSSRRGEPSDPVGDLAGELAGRGHDVTLFAPADRPCPAGVARQMIAPGAGFARRCARAVAAAGRFDVVHAFEGAWHPAAGPAPHVLQILNGAEIRRTELRSAHAGATWLRRLADLLQPARVRRLGEERAVAGSGVMLVAPSPHTAAELRQYYGVPDERLRVVYEGVPAALPAGRGEVRLDTRRRLGLADRETLVLAAVADPRTDGPERLAAVAAAARAELAREPSPRPLRMVVFAPGLRRVPAPAEIAPAGLGWAELLAAADVFATVSAHDAAGRFLLSALAAPTACVAARSVGAAELIDDARNGFVVDRPDDVAAVADRVLRLTESVKRFTFRNNLRDLRADLSVGRAADELLGVYGEALARPGRTPV